jgi:hypothetical protein
MPTAVRRCPPDRSNSKTGQIGPAAAQTPQKTVLRLSCATRRTERKVFDQMKIDDVFKSIGNRLLSDFE